MSYETDLSIVLQAYDQASDVIQSVNSSLSQVDTVTQQVTTSTSNMGEAYQNAASQVDEINSSYSTLNTSTQQVNASTLDNVVSVNSLALAGATLFMAFERVENSQVMLDRANLVVEKGTNTLQAAQEAYNKALAEYGPTAQQTIDAAAKLATAQDNLAVAQERVDMAQRNLTNSEIYASLTVIPSLIAIGSKVYSMYQNWQASADEAAVSQETLNATSVSGSSSMVGLGAAIGGVVAGIALLVNGYETANSKLAETEAAGQKVSTAYRVQYTAVTVLSGGIAQYASDQLCNLLGVSTKVCASTDELTAAFLEHGTSVEAAAAMMEHLNYTEAAITTVTNAMTVAYGGATTAVAYLSAADEAAIAVENTRYQTELTTLSTYWSTRFGITKTALETIDDEINTYYNAQETAATTEYNTEVTAANAAYNKQLTAFSTFWTTKLGLQTTELTTVDSEINRYYAAEITATQTAYNQQISDTNTFYDDLVASTMTGLNNIRAARTADLNNLELNMLLQKTALEDAHTKGLISDADYQTQLNTINTTYNAARSDMSDHYRLQELEAENQQSANAAKIESARSAALTTISNKEATDVTAINAQKNTDLTAAAQQFATLTTTGLQTLNTTLTTLANNLAATLLAIENQKNADLQTAYAQSETAVQTHYNNMLEMLTTYIGKVNAGWSLQTHGEGLTEPPAPSTSVATAIAAIATIQSQNAAFLLALQNGQITQAEYNTAMGVQNVNLAYYQAIAGMQYGGTMGSSGLAIVGEEGPELLSLPGGASVIPLSRGEGYGAVTYDFSGFSVTINVEGSVDQRTLAVIKEELKNAVVEATSSGAPATQKRIRLGSSRFSG
jgi:hypothetical protein